MAQQINITPEISVKLDVETEDPKYDLLIFVGRFQPFHVEHKRIIDIALQRAKKVLVLVGSAGSARTVRNLFNYTERRNMILNCYPGVNFRPCGDILNIEPLYDKTYKDDSWIKQIQDIVNKYTLPDDNVGLIGCAKDHTSYYLKMFPQFDSINVEMRSLIHATGIREPFLAGTVQKHELIRNILPSCVAEWMFDKFMHTPTYSNLRKELFFVRDYRKQWSAVPTNAPGGVIVPARVPYPVKHVTCDSVVTQSGHILLVKRKSEPGKGLWALPGGHLNEFETIEEGVLRELKEETCIELPKRVLQGSIVARNVYDDPHRSTLGRVITHCYHIKLKDSVELPIVRGEDDAEKAKWIPIADLKEDMLFDDHFHIVNHILGL